MEVYDATKPQLCKICGITFNHNKQGRFTSHLINQHHLTLDNYFSSYFYPVSMLICSYILCN